MKGLLTLNKIRNKILVGHNIDIMRKIPDDSIDMVIYSPPYYGLRFYGTHFQIWGGDPECEHKFVNYRQKGQSGGDNPKKLARKGKRNYQAFDNTFPAFCSECGAWYGELGNEPSFELFVEHLVAVNKEVMRILKPSGTLWVNLGDSVGSETPIWVFNGQKKKSISIESLWKHLVDNKNHVVKIDALGREIIEIKDDIEIMSVDKEYKVIKTKPSHLIRHKYIGKIQKVRLSGNELLITKNHSLINTELEEAKAEKNKRYLCLNNYAKNEKEDIMYINVPLEKLEQKNVFVEFFEIDIFIEKHRNIIKEIKSKGNDTHWSKWGKLRYWKENKLLPLSIFLKLKQMGLVHENNLTDFYIRPKTNSNDKRRTDIAISSGTGTDFLKFLGLWLADGSFGNNTVSISTGNDPSVVNFLKSFCKTWNYNYNLKETGDFSLNTTMFRKMLQALGFSGNSHTKRVPNWIFDLSQKQIGKFLNGFITGDGNVYKGTLSFSSVNRDLRDDIADLFRFIGYSVRCTEQKGKTGYSVGNIQYSGILSVQDSYSFLGKHRLIKEYKRINPKNKAFKRVGDCRKVQLTKLTEEDYDGYVYDISVPNTEIFVSKTILLHNTYWGGGQAQGHTPETKNLGGKTLERGNVTSPVARGSSYPSKCLCLVPDRFRIAMVDSGWIIRNKNIWYKPNGMPHSVRDRLTVKTEDFDFFTKKEDYFFDLDSVRSPLKPTTLQREKYTRIHQSGKSKEFMDKGILPYSIAVTPDREHKSNPMGANPGNIFTAAHEILNFFVKEPRYFFDLDAIRVKSKTYEQDPRCQKEKDFQYKGKSKRTSRLLKSKKMRAPTNVEYAMSSRDKSPEQIVEEFGYDPRGTCKICGKSWASHVRKGRGKTSWGEYKVFVPCNQKGSNPSNVMIVPTIPCIPDSELVGLSVEEIIKKHGLDPKGSCPVCGGSWKKHVSRPKREKRMEIDGETSIRIFTPCSPLGKNPANVVLDSFDIKDLEPEKYKNYWLEPQSTIRDPSKDGRMGNLTSKELKKFQKKIKNYQDRIEKSNVLSSKEKIEAYDSLFDAFDLLKTRKIADFEMILRDQKVESRLKERRDEINKKGFTIIYKHALVSPDNVSNPFKTIKMTYNHPFIHGLVNTIEVCLEELNIALTKGIDPGTFWAINTEPMPMAHFAVYPTKLLINPIKAGCPKYVCARCGKPKEWDCGCEAGFNRGIVLDPFFGCYDNKTQVLTRRGWTPFKDVKMTTELATEDLDGNLIYARPTALFKYRYEGEMYRFKTKFIDLLVTPNHRMYVKPKYSDWRFLLPQDVKSGHKIRRNTNWNGENKKEIFSFYDFFEMPMENWLKFFGIWLADGHTTYTGKDYRVEITQKNHIEEFRKILSQTPFEWKEYKHREGSIRFRTTNSHLYRYLEKFGKAKDKYIPRDILDLPPDKINMFLDAFCLGDGRIYDNGSRHFWTSSEQLANDLQEALFKSGTCGYISSRESRKSSIRGREINSKSKIYEVHESVTSLTPKFRSQSINLNDKNRREPQRRTEDYSGYVYCAEVLPSHLLYVRRNGKACWCGNSGTTGIVAKRLGRDFVGIELNREYIKIAKKRLSSDKQSRSATLGKLIE